MESTWFNLGSPRSWLGVHSGVVPFWHLFVLSKRVDWINLGSTWSFVLFEILHARVVSLKFGILFLNLSAIIFCNYFDILELILAFWNFLTYLGIPITGWRLRKATTISWGSRPIPFPWWRKSSLWDLCWLLCQFISRQILLYDVLLLKA